MYPCTCNATYQPPGTLKLHLQKCSYWISRYKYYADDCVFSSSISVCIKFALLLAKRRIQWQISQGSVYWKPGLWLYEVFTFQKSMVPFVMKMRLDVSWIDDHTVWLWPTRADHTRANISTFFCLICNYLFKGKKKKVFSLTQALQRLLVRLSCKKNIKMDRMQRRTLNVSLRTLMKMGCICIISFPQVSL